MPLQILGPLVVFGILGIAALLHFTGHSRAMTLHSADQALEQFARQFPDIRATSALLSSDSHAALITSDQGPALLWSFGQDTTARMITDQAKVTPTAKGLKFHLADFSAPAVAVTLNDPDRARWQATLAAKDTP